MNFSSNLYKQCNFYWHNKSSSHNKRLCNLAQLNGTDNQMEVIAACKVYITNKIISEIFRHNVKKMHILKSHRTFFKNYFLEKFFEELFFKRIPPPFL